MFHLLYPMINDYYAIAIGAATREEIDKITEYVFKVNETLFFALPIVNFPSILPFLA